MIRTFEVAQQSWNEKWVALEARMADLLKSRGEFIQSKAKVDISGVVSNHS
jgi:hypothetical protein